MTLAAVEQSFALKDYAQTLQDLEELVPFNHKALEWIANHYADIKSAGMEDPVLAMVRQSDITHLSRKCREIVAFSDLVNLALACNMPPENFILYGDVQPAYLKSVAFCQTLHHRKLENEFRQTVATLTDRLARLETTVKDLQAKASPAVDIFTIPPRKL